MPNVEPVKLDPKAAAEAIRPLLVKYPVPATEDEERIQSYIMEVCKHLGLEPTPLNFSHVTMLLARANIERHDASEYPKALNKRDRNRRMVPVTYPDDHPKAGQDVVFENEAEETAYHAAMGGEAAA
jgi:hypothetical protein